MECGWDTNTIGPSEQGLDASVFNDGIGSAEECHQACLLRPACKAYRWDSRIGSPCALFNVGIGPGASNLINPTPGGTQWYDRNCPADIPAGCTSARPPYLNTTTAVPPALPAITPAPVLEPVPVPGLDDSGLSPLAAPLAAAQNLSQNLSPPAVVPSPPQLPPPVVPSPPQLLPPVVPAPAQLPPPVIPSPHILLSPPGPPVGPIPPGVPIPPVALNPRNAPVQPNTPKLPRRQGKLSSPLLPPTRPNNVPRLPPQSIPRPPVGKGPLPPRPFVFHYSSTSISSSSTPYSTTSKDRPYRSLPHPSSSSSSTSIPSLPAFVPRPFGPLPHLSPLFTPPPLDPLGPLLPLQIFPQHTPPRPTPRAALKKRTTPFPPYFADLEYLWSSVWVTPACSCIISSALPPVPSSTTKTVTRYYRTEVSADGHVDR